MRILTMILAALALLASPVHAQNAGNRRLIFGSGAGNANGLISAIEPNGYLATTQRLSSLTFQPDTAPQSMACTDLSYDSTGTATTLARNLIITQQARYPYPSYTTKNPSRVALHDYAFTTTSCPGVTNRSTLTAPKPIAVWLQQDHQTVYTSSNTLVVQFFAAAGTARNQKPAAAAKCTASDGTNAMTVTATFGDITKSTDQFHVPGYTCTFNNMSAVLTPGTVTVNAVLYPWIGSTGSVLDSSSSPTIYFTPRSYLLSTGARYYSYVSGTGNDTTCVASTTAATAAASPCLTPAGGINKCRTTSGDAANCNIRLMSGSAYTYSTPTASATLWEAIIEGDPACSCRPTLNVSGNLSLKYVRLQRLAIVTVSASTIAATSGGQMAVVDCTLDATNSTTSPQFGGAGGVYIDGLTISVAKAATLQYSSTNVAKLYRGLNIPAVSGGRATVGMAPTFASIGNNVYHNWGASVPQSGIILGFNKWHSGNAGAPIFSIGTSSPAATISGLALVENIFEWVGNSSSIASIQLFSQFPDEAQVATNIVMQNNTFVNSFISGRGNFLFDDDTDDSVQVYSTVYSAGNIHGQYNMKTDIFAGINNGDPHAYLHVGNWDVYFGTGHSGNIITWIDTAGHNSREGVNTGFSQIYPGISAKIQTTAGVAMDMKFTSYAANTYDLGTNSFTLGAGDGNYHVASNSPAKGNLPNSVWPIDLDGTARPMTNDTSGAYVAP